MKKKTGHTTYDVGIQDDGEDEYLIPPRLQARLLIKHTNCGEKEHSSMSTFMITRSLAEKLLPVLQELIRRDDLRNKHGL